jgi:hypothetical protein
VTVLHRFVPPSHGIICSLLVTAAVVLPRAAGAQGSRDAPDALPASVGAEVRDRWNAPGVRRTVGVFTVTATDTVRGDHAVLNGPVRIAGVLAGRLLVVNGSVVFERGAVITSDVLVVGGTVTDRPSARLDGEVRVWRDPLAVRLIGDSLVAAPDTVVTSTWERWKRDAVDRRRVGDFFIASAHTYNRVEGLPLLLGPRLKAPLGDRGRLVIDALGIVRTGTKLEWTPENRGHDVRAELVVGSRYGASVEGRLFDDVTSIEPWTLRETELGLGTLLFTRDYADYYGRKGASARAVAFAPGGLTVGVTLSDERWRSRAARDVWSVIDRDRPFRANPLVDEGRMHLTTVTLTKDTRNDRDRPRTGWWIDVQHENGVGDLTRIAPTSVGVRGTSVPGRVRYGRLLADVRRYLRLAPNTQLNARLVVGARTSGTLPMQRRLSASGIDLLPGFTFRTPIGNADVGSCSDGDRARLLELGAPAQCDGMAVLQLEWRGEFSRGVPRHWPRSDWIDFRGVRGAWVLFVNTGRGWLTGDAPRAPTTSSLAVPGTARFAGDGVLPLGSLRTDVGGGLDLGFVGLYVAAPVSSPGAGRTPTVFLRTGRRF